MEHTEELQPSFFDAIHEGDEATCRALWLSVILQQILDARGRFGNSVTQRQAQIWLEGRAGNASDFAEVCRLANVDFNRTRNRCAEILSDDTITIDFRAMKLEKEENRTMTNRRRYLRRAERNQRNRKSVLEAAQTIHGVAANDNHPEPANDNFINPTKETNYDE